MAKNMMIATWVYATRGRALRTIKLSTYRLVIFSWVQKGSSLIGIFCPCITFWILSCTCISPFYPDKISTYASFRQESGDRERWFWNTHLHMFRKIPKKNTDAGIKWGNCIIRTKTSSPLVYKLRKTPVSIAFHWRDRSNHNFFKMPEVNRRIFFH